MKSPTRAGGFVWKYSPLLECCNDNLFRHAATTADTVIPCSGTLADRTPSLLPFPIDGRGQPLFSAVRRGQRGGDICGSKHEITSSQGQWHPAHSCFSSPSSFFFLFPFSALGPASSFTSTRVDDDIPPTPHFSTCLPSPSSLRRLGSFPIPWVRLNRLFLHPFLVLHPRPLGRIPFPFFPSPLPSFLHLLLIRHLSSRLLIFLASPSHPCLRFLRHFTLFFTFVNSHNVLRHVLS